MLDFKRTIRIKILNQPGIFGKVTDTVGSFGGSLGNISIVRMGTKYRIRDLEIYTMTQNRFEEILWKLGEIKEIKILEVFDDILKLHEGGMIKVKNTVKFDDKEELAKYYIPGISHVAELVNEEPQKVYEYTNVGNVVGVVSNGTSLLNFKEPAGPEATYTVMEGLSAVINKFSGVSALPLVVNSQNIEEFIATIKNIYKSFGMLILEDISSPASIEIEEGLQGLDIPVIDTNRYGNAIVTLAALIKISEKVNIDLRNSRVGIIGFGSKSVGICRMLKAYGVDEIIACDTKEDAKERMEKYGAVPVSFNEVMNKANIIIAASRVGGLIKFGMVKPKQIILALSKPTPEIEPEIAMKAGALYAVDGKMVSPLLAIPGLIKGTMLARSKKITENMMITAAQEIAALAGDGKILPELFDKGLHEKIAEAVKQAAIDEGAANLWEIDIEDEKDEDAQNLINSITEDWMVS